MLGPKTKATIFNENEHLRRTKNEKKEVLTPRRPFNLITNHKTPSSAKINAINPKSVPAPITIFEDSSLEKVEEKPYSEQNSFDEICAEFEKNNGPMKQWEEIPDVERFSVAPPPSPLYEHENSRGVRISAEPKDVDFNSSFDELCAQLYQAPTPLSGSEIPPIEIFPKIVENMSDFQIPIVGEELKLRKDDDAYVCTEISDDSFDSDLFDENSYFIELNQDLDLIY